MALIQDRDQAHGKETEGRIERHVIGDGPGRLLSRFAQWPTIWRYEECDVIAGEEIVAVFKPFLFHLLRQALTRKTLNLHRDNLWLLGGELIRDLHETPKLRKRPAHEVGRCRRRRRKDSTSWLSSESEQRSFDSTCKKLSSIPDHVLMLQRVGIIGGNASDCTAAPSAKHRLINGGGCLIQTMNARRGRYVANPAGDFITRRHPIEVLPANVRNHHRFPDEPSFLSLPQRAFLRRASLIYVIPAKCGFDNILAFTLFGVSTVSKE